MKKHSYSPAHQELAERLPIALIFLDSNLCMLWWNFAAQQMLTLDEKRDRGRAVNDFFIDVALHTYLAQKDRLPIQVRATEFPNLDLSLLLVDYPRQHYLLVVQDVTHLQRLERMRQDFVANVSHELRTPLTVLHGYLEMLLELNNNPGNNQHSILEQMYQQSVRMERLLEDLLLLSRLDNYMSEDRRSLVDVPHLLHSIAEDARILSRTQQHKIELNVDPTLKIQGTESELSSAFSNLILNAINYTSAAGEIKIAWYKLDKHAYLEVSDTGIGIAAEHIPRLTERFYRVDKARSRSSGGTGLGLAIVKHVLFRHKANLKITSKIGKGSTFTCIFSLPN